MEEAFLALVRLGIGNAATEKLPNHIDWDAVETLAEKQGVLGVVYDGALSTGLLPLTVKLRWIGKMMQGYEQRYVLYRKAVADLTAWYHAHGYRMMMLKGLACGMDWLRPEHRPYGDIDIWLFGKQKRADKTIEKEIGIKIDNSQHHHSVFQWQGFTVENHYDFINVHARKKNKELEHIFKTLAEDDSHTVVISEKKVYLPSANLHVLFLIRHLAAHFSSERLTLRQLLDWAFFVKNHGSEVDWLWLEGILDCFGFKQFYNIVNAICVNNLGFDVRHFPSGQFDPFLKERVLKDIITPEFLGQEPKHIMKRVPFKYRRWKLNGWKRELCFNESPRSDLWSGIKSHLMKPASI